MSGLLSSVMAWLAPPPQYSHGLPPKPTRRRRRRASIYDTVVARQYSARKPSYALLTPLVHTELNMHYHSLPHVLDQLRRLCDDDDALEKALQAELASPLNTLVLILFRYLTEEFDTDAEIVFDAYTSGFLVQHERPESARQFSICNRDVILLFGGLSLLSDIIVKLTALLKQNPPYKYRILSLATECLTMLRQLVTSVDAARSLGNNMDFLRSLFELMRERATFNFSVFLMEEILTERGRLLDLNDVPGFVSLATNLELHQLAVFCRILALVVYDAGEAAAQEECELLAHPGGNRSPYARMEVMLNKSIIKSNHQIVLDTPDLMARLVRAMRMENPLAQPRVVDLTTHRSVAMATSTTTTHSATPTAPQPMDTDNRVGLARITITLNNNNNNNHNAAAATNDNSHTSTNESTDMNTDADNAAMDDDDDGLFDPVEGASLFMERILGVPLFNNMHHDQHVTSGGNISGDAAPNTPQTRAVFVPLPVASGDTAVQTLMDNFAASFVIVQAEVLFVLYSLLGGPLKQDVQIKLAQCGLVVALERQFRQFTWGTAVSRVDECFDVCGVMRLMSTIACIMTKIQFLRVVHNFCDNSKDARARRLLLTTAEREHLKDLHESYMGTRLDLDIFYPDTAVTRVKLANSETGLIRHIIQLLIAEPVESQFKYWLSSCIETYLRGSSMADQLFVIESGLLPHIKTQILLHAKLPQTLQGSFDLLGEMLKFNPQAFVEFDRGLTDEEFTRLLDITNDYLIDSNVFIRCCLMSFSSFEVQLRDINSGATVTSRLHTALMDVQNTRLVRYLSVKSIRVRILRHLLGSVSVDEITNENVCCLNTSIIMLMLADRNGELEGVLQDLRQYECDTLQHGAILGRFHSLLVFWTNYYRRRGKECASLELTTRIPAADWWSMSTRLLGDGPQSIPYYLSSA